MKSLTVTINMTEEEAEGLLLASWRAGMKCSDFIWASALVYIEKYGKPRWHNKKEENEGVKSGDECGKSSY